MERNRGSSIKQALSGFFYDSRGKEGRKYNMHNMHCIDIACNPLSKHRGIVIYLKVTTEAKL
jgi:hypothetical protein